MLHFPHSHAEENVYDEVSRHKALATSQVERLDTYPCVYVVACGPAKRLHVLPWHRKQRRVFFFTPLSSCVVPRILLAKVERKAKEDICTVNLPTMLVFWARRNHQSRRAEEDCRFSPSNRDRRFQFLIIPKLHTPTIICSRRRPRAAQSVSIALYTVENELDYTD